MKTEKFECLVDFDYDLIQDDCHWDLDRYFRFTYKVLDPEIASKKELYYRIVKPEEIIEGKTVDDLYTRIYTGDENLFAVGNNTWIYHLRISDLGQQTIINNRDSEGNITVEALIRTTAENAVLETFSQYLELPPTLTATKADSELPNIQTDYVKSNPGEFLCTWSPATVADCEANNNSGVDTVDGYSIEIFYKPEKADDFVQLKGITWNADELVNGVYKLIKDPDYKEPEFSESQDLTKDFSLESQHTMSEVRIESPLKTEFFFTPKTLGILPGSSYQFRIYPYSHYEGALISTKGTDSSIIDVPKGIVRVKTANGWVEGQVWVMTESGWKNAEVIYTKTADGWKEAQ